jgi:GNAT superfamily N-acetyltransferase
MKTKKATSEDVQALAIIFNDYRIVHGQEDNLEATTKFVSARLHNKEAVIFVAISEAGTFAGFIQLFPVFSSLHCTKDYSVKDLFVAEGFENNTVAILLMEAAKKYAYQHEAAGISLEIAAHNPLLKLYERLGWHVNNSYLQYYWKANSYPKVEQKYINEQIGFGVFASTDIKKGEIVLRGKSVYKTTIRDHKTLQINEIEHSRLDTPFENTNHSCNPNTGVKDNAYDGYDLIALKDIRKGDHITMDYSMTEWETDLSNCGCNAENCRKIIKGAKYLSEETIAMYNGLIANYVKEKRNL